VSLQEYIDSAVEELNNLLEEVGLGDECWIEERLSGISDSNTPIHYSNIMEAAMSDFGLLHSRPDLACDESSPMDMIQLNIGEEIRQALYERFEEWKEEKEEEEMYGDESECYYGEPECTSELWQCETCGEWYCMLHNHSTSLGQCVECVACEEDRLAD